MSKGVVKIAGLDSAPAGYAGVLVGQLDDFGFCGGFLFVLALFSFFSAVWRKEVLIRCASPTSTSTSSSPS